MSVRLEATETVADDGRLDLERMVEEKGVSMAPATSEDVDEADRLLGTDGALDVSREEEDASTASTTRDEDSRRYQDFEALSMTVTMTGVGGGEGDGSGAGSAMTVTVTGAGGGAGEGD